jgi:hypothetical protein
MEFAESWKPLMKSNARATTMMNRTKATTGRQLFLSAILSSTFEDVIALVDGILQCVEDLLPFDDFNGWDVHREQRAHTLGVQRVALFFQQLDGPAVFGHALWLGHIDDGLEDLPARLHDHFRELHTAGARLRHPEHHHPARRAIDDVDDVVQSICQQVDVFTIERCYEARIDALVDRVNDRIAFRLHALDLGRNACGVSRAFEQCLEQRRRTADVFGELAEIVKERVVLGKQLHR